MSLTLNEWIKRVRLANNMTLKEMSKICPITKSELYDIEHGKSNVPEQVLTIIEANMGITPKSHPFDGTGLARDFELSLKKIAEDVEDDSLLSATTKLYYFDTPNGYCFNGFEIRYNNDNVIRQIGSENAKSMDVSTSKAGDWLRLSDNRFSD